MEQEDRRPDSVETSAGASASSPSGLGDDLIGQVLGQYRVDARLGAGAMGQVYRAFDTRLNRPVAIKWLANTLPQDQEHVRRFQAEARAASSLNHPGILVVHDFGDDGRRPFIVTEEVHAVVNELVGRGFVLRDGEGRHREGAATATGRLSRAELRRPGSPTL